MKSALISGPQWDIVLKVVNGKPYSGGGNFGVSSTLGNPVHQNDVRAAGANEACRVFNIYDLAGNAGEITAERIWDPGYFWHATPVCRRCE